jgi:hypothetical protein
MSHYCESFCKLTVFNGSYGSWVNLSEPLSALLCYGQTPLCEQVGQLVAQHHQRTCWAPAKPAPNKLYNLLGAGLARAQHHDVASAQQDGQQAGSVEFISQQVVQQVRVWCTRHERVGQQVANLLVNKMANLLV